MSLFTVVALLGYSGLAGTCSRSSVCAAARQKQASSGVRTYYMGNLYLADRGLAENYYGAALKPCI